MCRAIAPLDCAVSSDTPPAGYRPPDGISRKGLD